MPWKKMLAYVTGEVDQSLLARVEYLIEENRILRNQVSKRLRLTDAERKTLAEKAVAMGKLMADTVTIVKPETRRDPELILIMARSQIPTFRYPCCLREHT